MFFGSNKKQGEIQQYLYLVLVGLFSFLVGISYCQAHDEWLLKHSIIITVVIGIGGGDWGNYGMHLQKSLRS